MPLVQTQAPAIEPVTLAEAKLHARVIDSAEDSLVTMLIAAARRYAEAYCDRSFITQKWRVVMDEFPECVVFERGPVQAVDSISYTDMAGGTQTVAAPAAPAYAIDTSGAIARMTPGFGYVWPDTLPQIAAARITYTAGYGATAADVPEGIRHWILMRVATAFENREEFAVVSRGALSALPYVDRLLDPYRTISV